MRELNILEKLKDRIGGFAWKVFLWSIEQTDEEYWNNIYWQEKYRRENK